MFSFGFNHCEIIAWKLKREEILWIQKWGEWSKKKENIRLEITKNRTQQMKLPTENKLWEEKWQQQYYKIKLKWSKQYKQYKVYTRIGIWWLEEYWDCDEWIWIYKMLCVRGENKRISTKMVQRQAHTCLQLTIQLLKKAYMLSSSLRSQEVV